MVDLSSLANIAEIVGGIVIVGGLGGIWWNQRQAAEERRRQAALVFMTGIRTPEHLAAAAALAQVPDGIDRTSLIESPTMMRDAVILSAHFHEIGMQWHVGVIPDEIMEQSSPDYIYYCWRKLHVFVRDARAAVGPSHLWSFEWMVGQMQERGWVPAEPAADPTPYKPPTNRGDDA